MNKLVICNDCKHFTRDEIGSGQGIGNCFEYDNYIAKEPGMKSRIKAFRLLGNKCFYPNSDRYCEKYEAIK